ncbi:hypothetical protein [Streptomyces yokosukanensis]|uniref:hypothetical protein n=1 Tax=Streptomyces yokosukanensis TaxID=67386 RepID=UPI00131E9ECA|nr:hypothetical protein [Streptomyces yokosukanensis]
MHRTSDIRADDLTALGAAVVPTLAAAPAEQETCSGQDGTVPCGRKPLPSRSVCGVHRVQELAGEVA